MAQALERLGERWGLLIVRDLLPGEQRFTDLLRSCGGVTPRQLAARLRQLQGDGIVEARREAGRREVWYRLTPAGQALRPAVEALLLWGIQHVVRPPAEDEPVRAFHVVDGTRLALNAASERPRSAVRWAWRFPGDPHTLQFDGTAWQLSPGEDAEADVVVETTPRAWAEFVAEPRNVTSGHPQIRLLGERAHVREFTKAFPRLANAE
jgi:DNA-binding HxlR family transcriptional regulator